jgi:cell division GTPase FtsZ
MKELGISIGQPTIENDIKTNLPRVARIPVLALPEQTEISPLILIDNQIVSQNYPAPITKFWDNANDKIASIFDEFNIRAGTGGGIENFDTSEFRSVIEAGGCIVFGKTNIATVSKASDIAKTFENNLVNGMLFRFNQEQLRTAKCGGAIIIASEQALDSVMEDDLGYGFTVLTDIIGGKDIFSGIYIDNSVQGYDFYTIVGGIAL